MITIERKEDFSTYTNTLKITKTIQIFKWNLFISIKTTYSPDKNLKLNKSED